MKCVHVIGAGLAGLSAAVRIARGDNTEVVIHEAAKHAGGRCRSFFEPVLGAIIDNGAHLMLNGNRELWSYLKLIGAESEVRVAERAAYPFLDVKTGAQWTLDLGRGEGWIALARSLMNRSHGLGVIRMARDLRALKNGRHGTVAEALAHSPLYPTFWEPFALAVLNTEPQEGSAKLLYSVLQETVLQGGGRARPLLTRQGLSAALVDPALSALERAGGRVHLGRRVRSMSFEGQRVRGIKHTGGSEVFGDGDQVVLAVPPSVAMDLLAGLTVPSESRAILNVHYCLPDGTDAPAMCGLVNARAQWVFVRGNVASVTVSAADGWMDRDADAIAAELWPDVARVLGFNEDHTMPVFRVIKERRATFAQTSQSLAHRPGARTSYDNLFLAGDWTDTGLPATIEGAVKSGRLAAEVAIGA